MRPHFDIFGLILLFRQSVFELLNASKAQIHETSFLPVELDHLLSLSLLASYHTTKLT